MSDAPVSTLSAAEPVTRREIRITFAGLMVALMLASLDQNIVSTALPRIVGDLGGMTHLSWVVTAFLLTSTTSTLLYGKLSDIYGRKPLFYVAISIFLLGSVLCGLSQSMGQLITFRGLQGLGAGGLMTLAQTTVGDLIAPRERGRYQGLFGAVFAASSVAGPLLGGVITDALSWRWVFYVNLPIGAVALTLIAVGLRHRNREVNHHIDYTGAFLLITATSCLLLALSWGGTTYPWVSPVILGLGAGAAIFYGLLLRHENRADEPVLPPRLFRDKIFVIAVSVVGLTGMALIGSLVFMPLYFQLVLGYSPSKAGLMIAPMMGGVIVASVLGGRLISRSGRYKRFPVFGLSVAALCFFIIALTARLHAPGEVIVCLLVVMGFGLGFVMPTLTVALQNAVNPADLGVATSVSAFFRSLGGAIGVAISGTIMALQLHRYLPESLFVSGPQSHSLLDRGVQEIARMPLEQRELVTAAFRHAISGTLLSGGTIAVIALITVLFLQEKPLRSAHPAVDPAPRAR